MYHGPPTYHAGDWNLHFKISLKSTGRKCVHRPSKAFMIMTIMYFNFQQRTCKRIQAILGPRPANIQTRDYCKADSKQIKWSTGEQNISTKIVGSSFGVKIHTRPFFKNSLLISANLRGPSAIQITESRSYWLGCKGKLFTFNTAILCIWFLNSFHNHSYTD